MTADKKPLSVSGFCLFRRRQVSRARCCWRLWQLARWSARRARPNWPRSAAPAMCPCCLRRRRTCTSTKISVQKCLSNQNVAQAAVQSERQKTLYISIVNVILLVLVFILLGAAQLVIVRLRRKNHGDNVARRVAQNRVRDQRRFCNVVPLRHVALLSARYARARRQPGL